MNIRFQAQKITLIAIVFMFVFFLYSDSVQAAPSFFNEKEILSTTLVATINVYDISFRNEEGKIKISFNVSNKSNVQPEIRYGVLLKKIDKIENVNVDRKVFDETIVLSQEQSVKKEIEYKIPNYFFGTHEVFLEIRTTQGLLLDYVKVGKINLSEIDQGVEIDSKKCNFISGDKNHVNLFSEGFYREKDNAVIARCPVRNNSKKTISVVPVLLINNSSPYGEILTYNKYDEISLQPGEEKEFPVTIPESNDNLMRAEFITIFFEKDGAIFSNLAESFIFPRNENKASARIINVRFDKTSYFLGDTAEMIINWDGVVLNEAGSYNQIQEISFLADLFTKNGKSCIDYSGQKSINKLVKQTGKNESKFSLHVIRNCFNPTLTISLFDQEGNQIAKEKYKIVTQDIKTSFSENFFNFSKRNIKFIFAFLLIVFFLWVAFRLIKRRMLYNKYIIPPSVFIFGLLWGIPGISNADTFYDSQSSMIYNISTDKTSYIVNNSEDQRYKIRASIQRYYYEAGRPWIPGYHLSLEVNVPGMGFSSYGTSQWMTVPTNILLSYGQISGAEIEAKTPFVRDFSKSKVESYLRAIINGSYVLGGEVLAKADINLRENGECGKLIYINEENKSDKACKFGSYKNFENKEKFGQIGKDGEIKWSCKNIDSLVDAECNGYVKFDAKCGKAAGKPICDMEKYISSAKKMLETESLLCENRGWILENEKKINGWGKTPGNFETKTNEGLKNWTCKGIRGGSDANCSLSLSSKAVCGPAANKSSKEVPSTGLCSNGKAKGVERSWEWNSLIGSYEEKWKWTCDFFDRDEEYVSLGCDVVCLASITSEPL